MVEKLRCRGGSIVDLVLVTENGIRTDGTRKRRNIERAIVVRGRVEVDVYRTAAPSQIN